MAHTYIHGVPSIRTIHPNLPPILANLDLDRDIVAGQPLDSQNLENARSVALAFKGLAVSGGQPFITPDVSENAQLRALAVESAHVCATYTPTALVYQLQLLNQGLAGINNRLTGIDGRLTGIDGRLTGIDNRLDEVTSIVNANSCNTRIMAYNSARTLSEELRPLQKTIPGHGDAKARIVRGAHIVQLPIVVPTIGQIPPNFNGDISTYQLAQILDLIIFYNDDFNILIGDGLPARQNKSKEGMVTIFLHDLCIHDGDDGGSGTRIKPGKPDHDGWQTDIRGPITMRICLGWICYSFKSFDLKSLARWLSWAPTSLYELSP